MHPDGRLIRQSFGELLPSAFSSASLEKSL